MSEHQTFHSEYIGLPPALSSEPRSPADVIHHPLMGGEAKRALLAAWASDRHAVPNSPGLRQLDDGTLMSLAEIMQALQALDEGDEARAEPDSTALVHLDEIRCRRRSRSVSTMDRRSRSSDDDDPPTTPAAASLPPRYFRLDARARYG